MREQLQSQGGANDPFAPPPDEAASDATAPEAAASEPEGEDPMKALQDAVSKDAKKP